MSNNDPLVYEPTAAVRGTVVVLHGRGEHPGVYERFSTRIAFDGYRVVVPPVTDALDVATLFAPYPEGGRILVGHDNGAALAWNLADELNVDAVVISGASPESQSVPTPSDHSEELDLRSACPVHRARLDADDTFDWGRLSSAAVAYNSSGPSVPVLFVHGENDLVADVVRAASLASRSDTYRISVFEDGRHDVLNDKMHRSVAATIMLFLEDVCKGIRTTATATVAAEAPLRSRRTAPVHISARLNYTLKALATLASDDGGPVKCETLARTWDLPLNSLVNIMGQLRRAGIVTSQRGCDGGYQLARPASEISVAEVVRAIEGAVVTQSVADTGQALWSTLEAHVTDLLQQWNLGQLPGVQAPKEPIHS